ncbi:hypothetical protein B0H19DRAFT_1136482 [Mycena capillaripes]|nr:hypothetical protein B0H19DRAFT_1136482 [Mycena capillaripes]
MGSLSPPLVPVSSFLSYPCPVLILASAVAYHRSVEYCAWVSVSVACIFLWGMGAYHCSVAYDVRCISSISSVFMRLRVEVKAARLHWASSLDFSLHLFECFRLFLDCEQISCRESRSRRTCG